MRASRITRLRRSVRSLRAKAFRRRKKSDIRATLERTLSAALPFLLLITFVAAVVPRWMESTYVLDGEPYAFTPPLAIVTPEQTNITVDLRMMRSAFSPTRYTATADDCLQSIDVNGMPVVNPKLPHCDLDEPLALSLGDLLRTGENVIRVVIHNNGGPASLSLRVSPWDPVMLAGLAALLFALAWAAHVITRGRWVTIFLSPEYWILFAGIALRIVYVLATPHTLRGHDTDGHIEYIKYLSTHWNLPPVSGGWEYWHPPAYYFLSSLWLRAGDALGIMTQTSLTLVQMQSLLLSIGVLVIIAWMGRQLFPAKKTHVWRMMFLGAAAVFPGLVYLAARINNDVLLSALGFACFALLLAWWKRPRMYLVVAIGVAIGLAMLTKNNGLLLLPLALAMFAARHPLKKVAIAKRMAVVGIVVIVMTGWLLPFRMTERSLERFMVGNLGNLNSGLQLENKVEHYLTFNPIEVVQHPFNNAWLDAERRQQFWEYLYRSAFFGEFSFEDELRAVAEWIVIFGMALLAVGLYGVYVSIHEDPYGHIPLLICGSLLLAGHAAFRWISPYASSQDFRYSTLLVIPITYFVIRGIAKLPGPARGAATLVFQCFLVLCTIFIVSLA